MINLANSCVFVPTTSSNPIIGNGLEFQAVTAEFLGRAATSGDKGIIVEEFLAVILAWAFNNGISLAGFNTFIQRVMHGYCWLPRL
jgi:ribose/xylose/arabinose/galactoside ABC-type transport system permease subunit